MIKVEKIEFQAYPLAKAMLEEHALPHSDIEDRNVELFSFKKKAELIGIGGWEQYGQHALLRSVVIDTAFQKKGFGEKWVSILEQQGAQAGVLQFYLLTTTARNFFKKIGYTEIPRSAVPDAIKNTSEFTTLCPDSAVCMTKIL